MRQAIITFLLLITISTASALCTPSDRFDPDITGSISLPNSIEAISSGSPITLELEPVAGVSDVRLRSVSATSNADLSANFLIEPHGDGYLLTPRFLVGSGLRLDDLENLEFDFEGSVSYTQDGERFRETICLGDLSVTVVGDVEGFIDDFERVIDDLSNADSIFELIRGLLGAARVMNDLECREAETRYDMLETSFEDHCTQWSSEIRAVVDGEATVADACAAIGDETLIARCQANLTGSNGAPECPALYENMLELEKNVSSVCLRNACAPVIDVNSHASSYSDPLSRTLCEGSDIDEPACRTEYERVQGPRCPGVNVTQLAKVGEPQLYSLANICTEGGVRDNITVLKDPASDLVSSASCMCLPALQGHVGQLERLYEWGAECLGADNSSRECKNSSYAFLCDMAVGTALQCGGLGYQEFSASTNVFADSNGDPLDFDDPDAVAESIENGGVYAMSGQGSISVDTDRLGRAICSSALGDEDVDWASVLGFEASASGETRTLCREGVELTEPCVCDLSPVSGEPLDICGTSIAGNQCSYDIADRDATCGPYDDSVDPNAIPLPTPTVSLPEPVDIGTPEPSVEIDRWTYSDAKRTITEWPNGWYGTQDGFTITDCDPYLTDSVIVEVTATGISRKLSLSSGPIALTETEDAGYIAIREYSCNDNGLDIEYYPYTGAE